MEATSPNDTPKEKHIVDLTESPDELSDNEDNGSATPSKQLADASLNGDAPKRTSSDKGDGDGDEDEDDDDNEDEEEDDEEDEEDEDDEEEEEDEPALKYERIAGELPNLLKKDSASAISISGELLAMGMHSGVIHVLDVTGKRVKSYKPHMASVIDISLDATADFVATASLDGQVVVHSLSAPESYTFDLKRPMRTVAMEPNFAKHSGRALVYGGMAGTLIHTEKGWLGHRETILHSGEGPIWQVRWRDRLIAWANDLGVKIYDTISQTRITFIDRPPDSPRADLFKCNLYWQDDSTLLIAWADHIKVARIRARPKSNTTSTTTSSSGHPPMLVEITAVFQLDCMISGVLPYLNPYPSFSSSSSSSFKSSKSTSATPSALLVLAYSPPDTSYLHGDEYVEDRAQQARKKAERPELRVISRAGEELAADALGITDFWRWGCNDYVLGEISDDPRNGGRKKEGGEGKRYIVLSPRDVVLVRPRDRKDHVQWLVERKRYEEALEVLEEIESEEGSGVDGEEGGVNAVEVGEKYIEHLIAQDEFEKAARLCPKVCVKDGKRWERWIFVFAEARRLQAIIPFVPTDSPRLDHLVYEMILAHLLTHDRKALVQTIQDWPKEIYDIGAVIVAVKAELDRMGSSTSASTVNKSVGGGENKALMECLADLYTANRQPGKALPYYLRLRRPNVFELIKDNNLFTDVKDQILLLVEFDRELMERKKKEREEKGLTIVNVDGDGNVVVNQNESQAVRLLVDHVYAIPIERVVQQLESKPYYLFLYLEALFQKDPQLAYGFADLQVKLYAEFASSRLIDFLRASTYYDLEKAYKICTERDLVPERVFLLGHMGNNKEALTLIIERLGDVNRAIDFAKERRDDDLWEDLLKYSETRPAFIRGLLENVGAEIDPIRLIRRIKIGLEIPGLKEALIKILNDFQLQISLLEGCQTILNGDSADLSKRLQKDQSNGFFIGAKSTCKKCGESLQQTPQAPVLLYLCRHVVHVRCVKGGDRVPSQPDPALRVIGMAGQFAEGGLSGRIAFSSMVRARVDRGCPVCLMKSEGLRT